MVGKKSEDKLSSQDFWEVSHAAGRLTSHGCAVSAQHIRDDSTRMQFNRELAYYARRIVNDVEQRRMSLREGLNEIRVEKESLTAQSAKIFLKTVGLSAGVAQAATGAGICVLAKSLGCARLGLPLILHGGNNAYENGRNLYEGRDDVQGPLRHAYQKTADGLGLSPIAGSLAYGAVDVSLSVLALRRMVLKEDAWRLYVYVAQDYVRAYKTMGRKALIAESIATGLTMYQLVLDWVKK